MTRTRRHSAAEIAAKLVQANDLARQGMLREEIARTLGVSVMTLHRWQKTLPQSSPTSIEQDETARFEEELGSAQEIAELQSENSRLRRLVTDLLLEKVKLAEEAQGDGSPPRGKTRPK